MLVLTRKQNEEIQIGDNITLRVVGVSGSRVRLAIDAPKEIEIYRPEPQQPCGPVDAGCKWYKHSGTDNV